MKLLSFGLVCSVVCVMADTAQAASRSTRRRARRTDSSLSGVVVRTSRAPGEAQYAERARALESAGLYVLALKDRLALAELGRVGGRELADAGELALAINRFNPLYITAGRLQSRGVSPSSWPAAFRAAVATYEVRQGRVARASEILGDVGALSSIRNPHAKARALFTASAIRAASNRLGDAIQILDAVPFDDASPTGALARVQKARLHYEMGHYTEALEELVRVQKSSPHWYDGLVVASWAAYKLRDDNLALGQALSLNSPHLARKFNPETHVLEAASLYRLCQYSAAQKALGRLRTKYTKMRSSISRFRRDYGERFAGVAAIFAYVRTGDRPDGYDPLEWDMIVDGATSSKVVSDADRLLLQAKDEADALDTLVPDSSPPWALRYRIEAKTEFEDVKRESYTQALRAIRGRLGEMSDDVARNLEGALAVDVEINTRLRERLMTGAVPRSKQVDFDAEIKKGYEFWPFEGEFWRDEVGGYAYATSDVCAPGQGGTEL